METGVALRLAHWPMTRRKKLRGQAEGPPGPESGQLGQVGLPSRAPGGGQREVQGCSDCPRGLHYSEHSHPPRTEMQRKATSEHVTGVRPDR